MSFLKIDLNLNTPPNNWIKTLLIDYPNNDFIIVENDQDDFIWFVSNFGQAISRIGGNEVVTLFGKCIFDLESFIYQLNRSLPVSYKLGVRLDVLYDLLLNFETEPIRRIILWNDAGHLLETNTKDFADIFELMVVSAYCNRNGISTIKPDGTPYHVDQRNFFVVNQNQFRELEKMCNKEFQIPSVNSRDAIISPISFNLIELVS